MPVKNYYNTDYTLLAILLLPTFLRRKIIIALMAAMLKPLGLLHGQFVSYSDSLIIRANNQVCYMQAMLNDEFDYYQRRIRVRVAPVGVVDSLLLWREEQDKPILLCSEGVAESTPFLLFRDGQIGTGTSDIEIVFPSSFHLSVSEEIQLKTLINRHKLASKKYRIVYE